MQSSQFSNMEYSIFGFFYMAYRNCHSSASWLFAFLRADDLLGRHKLRWLARWDRIFWPEQVFKNRITLPIPTRITWQVACRSAWAVHLPPLPPLLPPSSPLHSLVSMSIVECRSLSQVLSAGPVRFPTEDCSKGRRHAWEECRLRPPPVPPRHWQFLLPARQAVQREVAAGQEGGGKKEARGEVSDVTSSLTLFKDKAGHLRLFKIFR